ncbi:hypothetical protein ACFY1P_32880 [Streptomyces sp. NPDC001407]|uniref:hypothetical protein n=1 Tax=Streptomyces sp. NPDC001407 TaxID=3364573 RepID=UPI0036CCB1D0
MPTARTLIVSSAAAATLLLTGCTEQPVKHGEVIDKRSQAGHWVPAYEDIARENCATTRTTAFSSALLGRGGSTGGKSTTSKGSGKRGSGGKAGSSSSGGSRTGGKQLNPSRNNDSTTPDSTGSATSGSKPLTNCKRESVGRKETSRRWQQGKWELKLRNGGRTAWVEVSQTTYDDTNLHDRI